MKCIGNPIAGEQFIREHFKDLQGKLFRPYGDKNIYALALKIENGVDNTTTDVYRLLSNFFTITKVDLGYNPKTKLEEQIEEYQNEHPYEPTPNEWLPEYHLERYLSENIVIGMYHDQEHWDWITGKNDKGSLIYNVRLDKDRNGAQVLNQLRKIKPKFAVLIKESDPWSSYHVFRIHDTAVMSEERMLEAMYPTNHGGPQGSYFIFRFDDEISIGNFNIEALYQNKMSDGKNLVFGSPIYVTGEELLKYKINNI
jgi:hypothetical protein